MTKIPEWLSQWADVTAREEPPREKPCLHYRRCPQCRALAYSLWKIYGVSYFKCAHCGHKSGNL